VTLMLALFLSQAAAAPQESEAARKAKDGLASVKTNIEKLMGFKDRDEKIRQQMRSGAADEERLKELARQREEMVKEFQALRETTVKSMDALIASTTEELKKTPDDLGLLEVRREATMIYGRPRESMADLERIAKLRPDDAETQVKLARFQSSHNRYESAAATLEGILKKDPSHLECRTIQAMCAFATHRFEESLKLYDELAKAPLGPEQKDQADQFRKLATDCAAPWKDEAATREKESKADDLPRVRLTTTRGEIEVELYENEAPNTVANFIELVEKKFYDGLTFHRILPGFMAQGGCPKGNGTGGPGYRFKDEVKGAFRHHFRGTLSMANSGPDTNGSQFFITHLPTQWLDGKHTVFGRVLKGQDTVDFMQVGDKIEKAEVIRKRDHEYKVVKLAEEK
jgi:cyclophilin family peptidyl-prolyl cis-trans isomerase